MTSGVSLVSEKNNNESNEISKLEKEDDDIEILSVEEVEPTNVEELEGTFVIVSMIDTNWCFFVLFLQLTRSRKRKKLVVNNCQLWRGYCEHINLLGFWVIGSFVYCVDSDCLCGSSTGAYW